MTRFYSLTLLVLSGAYCYGLSPTPANTVISKSGKTSGGIHLAHLCQHWVHSFEEQKTNKDHIYRPATFKEFPPSRFRMRYKFFRNGDCEWFYLAPNDGHHFKSGKWRIDLDDKAILQITTEGTTVSYRVIKLTKDMLRLRRVESKRNE